MYVKPPNWCLELFCLEISSSRLHCIHAYVKLASQLLELLLNASSAHLLMTISQPVSSSRSVDKESMQSKDIDDIQIKQFGVVHPKGAT